MSNAAAMQFPSELRNSIALRTDWKFLGLFIFVFVLYSVVVGFMSTIPLPETTEDDIRELQNKFAKFVLKEEPIKEEVVEEAVAETGAQEETVAKDKAKDRVKERSSASAEEKAAARQARAAERAAAREQAAAQVANVGALAMLTAIGDGGDDEGGEEVEDLIGSGGVQSANLGKALSNLDGLGKGGRGAGARLGSRSRRGGGSSAAGGGVDDLLSGIGGAKSRSLTRKGNISLTKPDKVVGKAAKSANRNIKAINTVLRKKQGAIQYCFKKELRKNPNLSGKITVRFTIEHSGQVSKANVVGSGINVPSLKQCLLKTVRRLKFKPIPASEGSMTVTYPFVFTAG